MNFTDAVERVLKFEGGYVNDPADRGGATNFGITLDALRSYRHDPHLTAEDVKNMTRNEAIQIYKLNYWDAAHLDKLDQSNIAAAIFDQCVNRGIMAAVKDCQLALEQMGIRLLIDGKLPVEVLNKVDAKEFLLHYFKVSQANYIRIVIGNLSQIKFLRGWMNRCNGLLDLL